MKRSRCCRFIARLILTLAITQILSAQYITGPRGGCYTIGRTGRKNYVDRSFCNTAAPVETARVRPLQSTPPAQYVEAQVPNRVRPQLVITSEPSGAEIEIDGEYIGSTPSTVSTKEGAVSVSVKKKGYSAWERTLRLSTGDKRSLSVSLEKP